jgi:titin
MFKDDDGGSEVTNYVVQKKNVTSNAWVPVSEFVIGTSCIVNKLHEGESYDFRVIAQNAIGLSDPLDTDAATLIRGRKKFSQNHILYYISSQFKIHLMCL